MSADLIAVIAVAVVLGGSSWLPGVLAATAWFFLGLHRPKFTLSVLNDLPRLALGCLVATLVAQAAQARTTAAALVGGAALLVTVLATRVAAYTAVRRLRSAGAESVPVVVLGCGPTSDTLVERVAAHPEIGIQVVGRFGERRSSNGAAPARFCGPLTALPGAIAADPARRLIVCEADEPAADVVEVLRRSRQTSTTVEVVPALHHLHALERATDEVWGLPLVRLIRPRHAMAARWCKRALDVGIATVVLVLTLPVLALVAGAVRWELGPGVLFRQQRVGLQGRHFRLLKFRSMPDTAQAAGAWSVTDVGGVGPVGSFIRKYSLDELPQLWNVLRGDMSLVGPRPERPEYVEHFNLEVPGYAHRHRMPVGLTGLAAVRGLRGGETSMVDRAYFDNLYIETWSLWGDIKILALTVRSVLVGTGG